MKNKMRTSIYACAALCLTFAFSFTAAQARDDNSQLVRMAQIRLADLGYDVGRLDGVMGQKTENAILDFQRNSGLMVTGQLTPETYSFLTYGRYVGSGVASYQPTSKAYVHTVDYNSQIIGISPVTSEDHWLYARDQDLPARYAHLNVREEDTGKLRHYVVMLNGQPILFANNQPGLLRASQTYTLDHEDAVIFTTYQASGTCPNKSYLLVMHSDGSYNQPYEVGNCSGNFDAHVSDNSLVISFPSLSLVDGWQMWGTWKYENNALIRS